MEADLPENTRPTPALLWSPQGTEAGRPRPPRYDAFIAYCATHCAESLAQHAGPAPWSVEAIHRWSISDLESFWGAVADFFEVQWTQKPISIVEPGPTFYQTHWFRGGQLSYAAQVMAQKTDQRPALVALEENGTERVISWDALEQAAGRWQAKLRAAGVTHGDRVVAMARNTPETIAAFLAVNGLGAIWSSCAPEFGAEAIVDRCAQIEPKVFLYAPEYPYNGKVFDLKTKAQQVIASLDTLAMSAPLDASIWEETEPAPPLSCLAVDADHPIWILYSSGTTGKPKAIVHRTAGMVLEHYKALGIHQDVQTGDGYFWYSTTGWMMWNYALSSLLLGATLYLYDGAPTYPDSGILWRWAARHGVDHFGAGAPFYGHAVQQIDPLSGKSWSALKTLGATGAPLSAGVFEALHQRHPQAQIISLSGGTDVCTAFVGGHPRKPVYAGYLQAPSLGADVQSWSPKGRPLTGTLGELVIAQPMPCMPVSFWQDKEFSRYHDSYFDRFPGVWCHGDWIRIDPPYGLQITGRSDATLNRQGVRIGTAEIYQALEDLPWIQDTLVLDLEDPSGKGPSMMPLFVVTNTLNADRIQEIKDQLRRRCSPRHVPDRIFWVRDIPYTLSGKKLEVPLKKWLMGVSKHQAMTVDALRNPSALDDFEQLIPQIERFFTQT